MLGRSKPLTLDKIMNASEESLDVGESVLRLSQQWGLKFRYRKCLLNLQKMVDDLEPDVARAESPRGRIDAINQYLFGELGLSTEAVGPEGVFLHHVLETHTGNCMGISILYLSVALRLGLPVHAAVAPDHMFVRYSGGRTQININTTDNGETVSTSFYRKRFQTGGNRFYLTDLTRQQCVGCFMTNLGIWLHTQGRSEDALSVHQDAIRLVPEYPEAYSKLASACLDLGRTEEAIAAWQEAIRLNPNYAEAHHNLGTVHGRAGQHANAEPHWKAVVRLKPGDFLGYLHLGLAYREQGQLSEAINAWERAVEHGAVDAVPDMLKDLAEAYQKNGRHGDAINAWRAIVERNLETPDARFHLATSYLNLGRWDEAMQQVEILIDQHPELPGPHCHLGFIRQKQERWDEAIAAYRKALEVAPNHGEAYYNLGTLLMVQEELDEAVRVFQTAVQLIPDRAELHTNLGLIHFQQEHPEEAIIAYHRALQINPELPEAHLNLGAVYGHLDDKQQAITHFELFIRLAADEPRFAEKIPDIQETIRSLREPPHSSAAC